MILFVTYQNVFAVERRERRDPPTFDEKLSDVTVFEGLTIYNIITFQSQHFLSLI